MFNSKQIREKAKVAMRAMLERILSLIVAGSEAHNNKLQEISNEVKELKQSQANLEEGIILTQTLCEEILFMLDQSSHMTLDMIVNSDEEDLQHQTLLDVIATHKTNAVDKDWVAAFGDRPMKKEELN